MQTNFLKAGDTGKLSACFVHHLRPSGQVKSIGEIGICVRLIGKKLIPSSLM
jgi:hypothetical protein